MKRITTPVTTPDAPKAKPDKPWPGYPLYWHPRGYWMCKRGGQERRYTADPIESHRRYLLDEEADRKGESPAGPERRYFLKDAVNQYLTRQKRRYETGELSGVQFAKCRFELEKMLPKSARLATPLGAFRASSPADNGPAALFHEIKRRAVLRGLEAAKRHVIIVRAALDYAVEKKMMLAPDYVDDFNPPSAALIDKRRNELDAKHGDRAWSIDELRGILEGAKMLGKERKGVKGNRIRTNPHLYAQVLLALFAGFGSDDCSAVPERTLIRDKGVVKFPRVKNGRPRVACLPKVVWDAIDASVKARKVSTVPEAKGLLFVTDNGTKCNTSKGTSDEHGILTVGRNDTIAQNFKRLVEKLKLKKYRAGFKTLRAMSRTLMVGSGVDSDLIAVIMGRKFRFGVDEYYLRGDLRKMLFGVAEHIEGQLFPKVKQTRLRPKVSRS